MLIRVFAVAALLQLSSISLHAQGVGPDQLVTRAVSAGTRISYGDAPQQFGDLRLPSNNSGRAPVAVVIHGGCWMADVGNLRTTAPLADALTARGIATWNIEYRRIGDAGGGWPGTLHDVARAVDHVRVLAKTHPIDASRVIVVGHSAGGHLALWSAARHRLPKSSVLYSRKPVRPRAAISISGPGDLRAVMPAQKDVCGDIPVQKLIGGEPDDVPRNFRAASPAEMLPLRVPQVMITGVHDFAVKPAYARDYAARARAKGETVEVIEVADAGHFEVIAPWAPAWAVTEAAILRTLDR
jgi:acetyl esterase/lipase